MSEFSYNSQATVSDKNTTTLCQTKNTTDKVRYARCEREKNRIKGYVEPITSEGRQYRLELGKTSCIAFSLHIIWIPLIQFGWLGSQLAALLQVTFLQVIEL